MSPTPFTRLRCLLGLTFTCLLGLALWTAVRSEAASVQVDVRDFAFQPQDLTVAVGDTVTWVNRDGEPHAVQGGPMSSPDLAAGGSYSHTFSSVGEVSYLCRIHTYMTGTVHVTQSGGGTTVPSPTTTAPSPATTAPPSTPTTAPGGPSTTLPGTPTTAPPTTGAPRFQEVPDDPSARVAPGATGAPPPPPVATTAPPGTSPPTTPTTAAPGGGGFQDVPDDPGADEPPGSGPAAPVEGGDGPAGAALGDGTFLAPSESRDGVRVFNLRMAPTTLTVAPGDTREAYAFNGVVPGPVLRVDEGDRVRIVVDNALPFATGVHWHGMVLPVDQDGVPGVTQAAIEPGQRYTYEWTAIAAGTHWYHSHSSGRHIGKGLYGVLEVVPRVGDFQADRDYRIVLGDTDLGFVLNGRSYPATPRLAAVVGEKVRLRVVNAGDQVHAMHLHGTPFEVVAQDGIPRRVPESMDTLTVSPGQTFDLIASPPNAGPWLFHCHIFGHSHKPEDGHEHGDDGMTGMVMILDVAPGGGAAALVSGITGALTDVALATASRAAGADLLPPAVAVAALWLVAARLRRRLAEHTSAASPNRKDTLR